MRLIRILLLLAVFVFGLLFLVQNSAVLETPLELQFNLFIEGLNWKSDGVPFYFIVLSSFAVGSLLTVAFFVVERISLELDRADRKRTVRTLEKELTGLKQKTLKLEKQLEVKDKQAKEIPGPAAAIDVDTAPAPTA